MSVKVTFVEESVKVVLSNVGLRGPTGATGANGYRFYCGSDDDPNGVVVPDDQAYPSMYYKLQSSPVVMWLWNTSTSEWFRAI